MKTFLLTTVILTTFTNAYAGELICTGKTHKVTLNSGNSTILVSPEMKVAVPAEIVDGPEEGLHVAYDKAETFLIYLGKKKGKITQGNLESSTDQDLEEKMTCTGSI